jgi:hypothetical protein
MVLITLVKVAYYVFGFIYLRRANVRRWFGDTTAAEPMIDDTGFPDENPI